MSRKINVTVADPAGNITIFVHDSFEQKDYSDIANKLLELSFIMPSGRIVKGEQVAFIKECPKCGRALGKIEMCGLEFCGNASRSFALITARKLGITGSAKIPIDVSGVNEILDVEIDTEVSFTKIKMPRPLRIFEDKVHGYDVTVADFGGIMHFVPVNVQAKEETFEAIKQKAYLKYNPPALGVMFWDQVSEILTPVVYVRDVDTTYFEGSCCSGSTALACVMGLKAGDGIHNFSFRQPSGVLEATCIVNNGLIDNIYIRGNVELSDIITVEIER